MGRKDNIAFNDTKDIAMEAYDPDKEQEHNPEEVDKDVE